MREKSVRASLSLCRDKKSSILQARLRSKWKLWSRGMSNRLVNLLRTSVRLSNIGSSVSSQMERTTESETTLSGGYFTSTPTSPLIDELSNDIDITISN